MRATPSELPEATGDTHELAFELSGLDAPKDVPFSPNLAVPTGFLLKARAENAAAEPAGAAAAGVSCRITKTDAVLASGTVDLQVASDGHGQSARITAGRVTLAYQPPTEVPPQR